MAAVSWKHYQQSNTVVVVSWLGVALHTECTFICEGLNLELEHPEAKKNEKKLSTETVVSWLGVAVHSDYAELNLELENQEAKK